MELCELPRLPSELIRMREAGYGEDACLGFDAACVGFARRFRRMAEETVEAWETPAKPPKGKVRVPKPKHSHADLLRVLGLDPADFPEGTDAAAARDALPSLRPEDFLAADWDDGGGA